MYKVISIEDKEPVTLDEAAAHVGMVSTDPGYELLAVRITAAREIAEQYTRRGLVVRTVESAFDRFPCSNNEPIGLEFSPVTSVTSVKYTDANGTEQTLDPAAYTFNTYGDQNEIYLNYGMLWPVTQTIRNAVRVRYVCGYAEPPYSVRAAILLMVGWMTENRGETATVNDIQPPAAKAVLETVKRWGC